MDRIQFNNIEVYSSLRGKLLDKVLSVHVSIYATLLLTFFFCFAQVFIPNSNVIEFTTDPNDVTYCEVHVTI